MAVTIRPNRLEVSDRFPLLGFTVRTDDRQNWFEVAVSTDPGLFRPEGRQRRTRSNFYSSRARGALPFDGDEVVYWIPPDILRRFAGQDKVYFGLATFPNANRDQIANLHQPTADSPWISLSSFSGRGTRRTMIVPASGRLTAAGGDSSDSCGGTNGGDLDWAGDMVRPGTETVDSQSPPPVPANGPTTAAPQPAAPAGSPTAEQSGVYDDGYGPMPLQDDGGGVDEPIPDDQSAQMQGYGETLEQAGGPEYPQASRYVQARWYRGQTSPRTIRRIVIHITDGGANINNTIAWFSNPVGRDGKPRRVSAHYIVGRDGEVVQMVRNNDVAWHAGSANSDSIGIEHNANTRGLDPTDDQYRSSAQLVRWLAAQYSIPLDRQHILGHAEADLKTTHRACPNAVWDWDYYMGLVTGSSTPTAQALEVWPSPEARSAFAQPLAIVTKSYTPPDRAAALQQQKDWSANLKRWRAGVPNTRFFPHSAICHLAMTYSDGSHGAGTGFYISDQGILTCAHNVIDWKSKSHATSIIVTPGKNDRERAGDPFTISGDSAYYHPSYDGGYDNDLAVLAVDVPPPQGEYFEILEEQRQSKPSPIIVCGYAGETGHRYRQNLDGDSIRDLSANEEQFFYTLQTERGSSGSPVYYVWGVEDEQRQQSILQPRVVGVHVSAFDGNLNRGCRLTKKKIAWIRSADNRTCSMGSHALGFGSAGMGSSSRFPEDQMDSPSSEGSAGGLDMTKIEDQILKDLTKQDIEQSEQSDQRLEDAASTLPGGTSPPAPGTVTDTKPDLEGIAADTPPQSPDTDGIEPTTKSDQLTEDAPPSTGDGSSSSTPEERLAYSRPQNAASSMETPVAQPMWVKEVATTIIGTVLSRVIDNEGDIHWELDKLDGMKHVNDDRANAGPGPVEDRAFEVPGPRANTFLGADKIYVDFQVEYQTDGRSVGNLRITPLRTNDAAGLGLKVTARVSNDARTYQKAGHPHTFAAIRLQFHYRFESPLFNDLMAVTDIVLYGHGDPSSRTRWTQT